MTANAEEAGLPLGQRLYEAGWRQGSVFATKALAFSANRLQPGAADVAVHRRNLKGKESLVVISQDCDIVSLDEPFVEAMICSLTSPERARRLDRNSARWFVIHPDTGLIAEAKHRLAIAKEALELFTPAPWPSESVRFRRFVRWLGRRYDRPALPTALVDLFQQPVSAALEAIEHDDPGMMAVFSQAVHEIRVTEPRTEFPPYSLNVYLMARGDGISDAQARAIDQVSEVILTASPSDAIDIDQVVVRFEAEMSVAEYFRTRPLFLEYLTYVGDEIAGAEPPPTR